MSRSHTAIACLAACVLAGGSSSWANAEAPTPDPPGPIEARQYRLKALSIQGCSGLPIPDHERALLVSDDLAVDVAARFWILDRPAVYRGGSARAEYRVGSGRVRVESTLARDLETERVRIEVTQPIGDDARSVYLFHVQLPCERTTRYAVEPGPTRKVDVTALSRFDAAIHEATELTYDEHFSEAEGRLQEAMALRPDDPEPYWMMARLRYLALEAVATKTSSDDRISEYLEAEHFADQAVERAPRHPEGYLWQAIARGRIATAQGNLRTAMGGVFGGRGPSWIERTLRRAVALPERFSFFGDTTRGDALYALAQFYRLVPKGWYMKLLGTRGDLDRAVELASEAVERQPVRIEYRKERAIALLCRNHSGDAAAARAELEALLALPAITPIDQIDHEHARSLLQEVPENICAYSRDGFLESSP